MLTHNAKLPCSGKNAPIKQGRQQLHTNGTLGKDQFYSHVDADALTKQAWEMGTPYPGGDGTTRKLYTFDFKIGTNNGKGVKTIDVRYSKKNGIHGFPTNKLEKDLDLFKK